MKKIHGETKNRVLGLCMSIATLFGSAAAKADVLSLSELFGVVSVHAKPERNVASVSGQLGGRPNAPQRKRMPGRLHLEPL